MRMSQKKNSTFLLLLSSHHHLVSWQPYPPQSCHGEEKRLTRSGKNEKKKQMRKKERKDSKSRERRVSSTDASVMFWQEKRQCLTLKVSLSITEVFNRLPDG